MFTYKYPHPAVAADTIVFAQSGGRWHLLLIQRANEPYAGSWAFPGGFLNPGETAEQGALRELQEETGLVLPHAEQLYAATDPDRDPREWVISIVHMAIASLKPVVGTDDAAKAQWFPVDALPPLAFDHQQLFELAKARLKERGVDILAPSCNI